MLDVVFFTEMDGKQIRVDYSVTQRPHTPTPGIYMGNKTLHREAAYRSVLP
jgi:transformer-2 protein